MEKLDSKKRQDAVNSELFETEEALTNFKKEKMRQTIAQKEQRADLDLWMYDSKLMGRTFDLQTKMIRKEPLDMGVNSKKPGELEKPHIDKRVPKYDIKKQLRKYEAELDMMMKMTIQELKELTKSKQGKRRPQPTSNNLNLDKLCPDEKRYLVITLTNLMAVK